MSAAKRKPTPSQVLAKLRKDFQVEFGLGKTSALNLLAGAKIYDKAYEFSSMIKMISLLKSHIAGSSFTLVNGSAVTFRTKGGPIQRGRWSYIEMHVRSNIRAEIWVDIECLALSGWKQNKKITKYPYGLAHELDVVLVIPGTSGRPAPHELIIGVEAKHRRFNKALLKELLGVRRETAFKSDPRPNEFAWWDPTGKLPAQPASGIVLFCSHTSVAKYNDPADYWGIEMIYSPY